MRIYSISSESIKFSNEKFQYELIDEHYQDCCEQVYADFDSIPRRILTKEGKNESIFYIDFHEDIEKLIEEVKDQGFMLCAKDGTKVLINCYDKQNGYYNSDLSIILYESRKIGEKEINDDNKIHEYTF